jgi:hypothetical protein
MNNKQIEQLSETVYAILSCLIMVGFTLLVLFNL